MTPSAPSLSRRRALRQLAIAAAALGVGGCALRGDPHGTPRGPRSDASVDDGDRGAERGERHGSSRGDDRLSASRPDVPELPDPARVRIRAVDIDEPLVEVGVADDDTMVVPDFGDAAWFSGQPKPGQGGAAVITGHVDSRTGPDVFFRLRELAEGDAVAVDREDGSTVTFRVQRLERHSKDEFPTEQVYGHTSRPTLRLITCDGLFDEREGSYTDNLIAYCDVEGGSRA